MELVGVRHLAQRASGGRHGFLVLGKGDAIIDAWGPCNAGNERGTVVTPRPAVVSEGAVMGSQNGTTTGSDSRATTALGVAVLAVVLYVIAMVVAQEKNDWLWPVAGVVGGVAAVLGWNAGKPRPSGKALGALVLGGLVFVTILVWTIWAAATGNM